MTARYKTRISDNIELCGYEKSFTVNGISICPGTSGWWSDLLKVIELITDDQNRLTQENIRHSLGIHD